MSLADPFFGHATPLSHDLADPVHTGGLGGGIGSGSGINSSPGTGGDVNNGPTGPASINPYQFGAFGSLNHDFGAMDFYTDPGYAWRMQQGINGIDRSAAARGGLMNGGTLRALDRYNQNFASNEYQNAYTRYNNNQANRFNRLAALSGIGQASQNQLTGYAQNLGGQLGNNIWNAGQAQSQGAVNQGNLFSSGLNGLGNAWAYYNANSPSNNGMQPGWDSFNGSTSSGVNGWFAPR